MDLPEAQAPPPPHPPPPPRHARESKSGSPEIFLLVESGRLENFGREIRNGILDPGLSWIPLHGATRRCSHPRRHETGIY